MSQLPEYGRCDVTCSRCGNSFTTRSTKRTLTVSACSKCHPYFTGGHDTRTKLSTQIERFNHRYNLGEKTT